MLNLYGIIPPRRIELDWLNIEFEDCPEWDEFIKSMMEIMLSDEN